MSVIKKRTGFTLIELSIVLVIIGLVAGGILIGTSMIQATKLRSVISDIEKFSVAVNVFNNKYACLPGDCANATDYFEQDAGDCATGTIAVGTCNGNNDDFIGILGCGDPNCSAYGAPYITAPKERFLAWQQLSLAGLIGGSYSGTSDARGVNLGLDRASVPGWNIPASRYDGAGYLISGMNLLGENDRWDAKGHWIYFGNPFTDPYAADPFYNGEIFEPSGRVISGTDALSIDGKIDDSVPGTGTVMTSYTNLGMGQCVRVAADGQSSYINTDELVCALLFKASF